MSKNTVEQSRRNFLIKGISMVPALALTGVVLDAAAPSPAQGAETQTTTAAGTESPGNAVREYQPGFFTAEEFAFITAAVARLIPKDELGDGALEAGVPEFIDRQMQTPYGAGATWYMQGPFTPDADPTLGYQLPLKPTEMYRLGIAEANALARKKHGNVFHSLTPEQQDGLLALMESGKAPFEKVPSGAFFVILLQNTREGFFCDPVHGGNRGLAGWKLIGFPGARADFMDWVERGEKYPYPPVSINGERG